MKKIKLTKDMECFVDDEDFNFLSKFKWYASKCGKKYYARRSSGKILMHREILNLKDSKKIVDHKNMNTLDNRKSNLRVVNKQQNGMNRPGRSISGYKGVTYAKDVNKWVAAISISGKRISIGYFKTKEDAAVAYNIKSRSCFGEYAFQNKIKK